MTAFLRPTISNRPTIMVNRATGTRNVGAVVPGRGNRPARCRAAPSRPKPSRSDVVKPTSGSTSV